MTLYVMDTDHLSLYERGYPKVRDRILAIRQNPADRLVITVTTVEEQFIGRLSQVHKAKTPQSLIFAYTQLKLTVIILSDLEILDYDARSDQQFRELRKAGVWIGTQDLRIASIVLSQNGILVTRNTRDFQQVPGLNIQDWSA
jgi:tRNA(fMet)-specific endonuclease VapC